MRVLIFEPQFVGHNFTYVDYLATRLIDLGLEVHLATAQQALSTDEFEMHLGHLEGKLHCHGISGFFSRTKARGISLHGLQGATSLMRGLHRALRLVRPTHLFVPSGNPLAHWMGIPNSVSKFLTANRIESEIVLLFGKYAYPHRGLRSFVKEKLAIAALDQGPWTRVHHILPYAVRRLTSYSQRMSTRTKLLPDPVDLAPDLSFEGARELLGISKEGRIASLIGLIERRKGVIELLEAFEAASTILPSTDRVLLAGKHTEDVRALLGGRYQKLIDTGRVISIDKHLSRDELWAACFASNVVVTPYPSHVYSASIVIRAAAANRFVLANNIGWMDETIRRFGLGTTCNTNDTKGFAAELVDSLNRSERYSIGESASRFIQFHAESSFSEHLTARIRERLCEGTAVLQRAA